MVKVWYEYKWHTKKMPRSRSGHKRSLYVRIVIKSCDTCFMAQFRLRTRKITVKIPFNLILSEKIEIEFKSGQKDQILKFSNFEKSFMFLMRNEIRNPMVPLVFM